MAKSVNKVFLLGNVGKDPEIRSTPSGTMVANFTLATSDRTQDPQGNWQDRTEWHNLVAFKRTAEIVRDYVKKGSKLFVEGKIQTRSWEDKDTKAKRYRTEIIVNDLSLLSGRDERLTLASHVAVFPQVGVGASHATPRPPIDLGSCLHHLTSGVQGSTDPFLLVQRVDPDVLPDPGPRLLDHAARGLLLRPRGLALVPRERGAQALLEPAE